MARPRTAQTRKLVVGPGSLALGERSEARLEPSRPVARTEWVTSASLMADPAWFAPRFGA